MALTLSISLGKDNIGNTMMEEALEKILLESFCA